MAENGKIRVFFLGSGEFAVPYLRILTESPEIDLLGIGTQPDKPFGRRRQLRPTPVGLYCDAHNISCERVESVSSDEFCARLAGMHPDILAVVSFGQILRERLLNIPVFGCLNVHSSLLPKYRGASPIVSAVLAGEKKTGVTFMRMDKGLDTGPVYETFVMPLPDNVFAAELEKKLSEESSHRIVPVIRKITEGLLPVPQDETKAFLTRKIKKTDGSVRWNESAAVIDRKFRAYFPWPGSVFCMTMKDGSVGTVRITAARPVAGAGTPGACLKTGKQWIIACGEDALEILRVVPEGSREMGAGDFLRGFGSRLPVSVLDGPAPVLKKEDDHEKK